MGFDAACTAIATALGNDPTLSALTVLINPVDQVADDLTLMVYPFELSWSAFSLDSGAGSGVIRVSLSTIERSTAAGGFAADMAAIRPYVDLIPKALARDFAASRFGETVIAVGDEATPWLRMDRPIREQVSGQDLLSLKFSLFVTTTEEPWT
jgi:hypothetical protein